MIKAFTQHPETVGESYLEHLHSASGFAGTMFAGAVVCFLHGLFPFAFQTGGSRRIVALHQRMVSNRHRHAQSRPATEPTGYLGLAEGI